MTGPAQKRRRRAGAPSEGRAAAEGSGFLPDLLRRGLNLGFTGLFMTEEAIRRALGDSVPRDVLEFLLEQSERTRTEFLDRLSKEFGRVLSRLDPVEVARRLLEGRAIEVTAQIRFAPDERRRPTARVEARAVREEDEA
jgi:hypothetical protein